MIGGQLAVALQVSDADLDAAFGEFRLLRGALQFAQPGASGLGLGGQGLAFDLGVGETRLMLGQFLVQRFEAGLGFLARGAQVFLVGRDFLQVLAQARGALAGLLGLLLQARMLELDVVHAARDFGHALARRRDRLGHLLPGDLGAGHGGAGLVGDQLLRLDFALQVLDLLLAGQQAGLFGVGRVEAHAVRVDQMAGLDHAGGAGRQRGAHGQRLGQIWRGIDPCQPLVEQRAQVGIGDAQQAGQRRQPGGRCRRGAATGN